MKKTDPTSTKEYVHVGDGMDYEIHLRKSGGVFHWTIEYDGEPFYAVRIDLCNEDLQLASYYRPDGILPPVAGWCCVIAMLSRFLLLILSILK